MSLEKNLEAIEEADLLHLIKTGTRELKTLEYKQTLPGTTYEDRKEFLADVSSFANTAGGHIVFGMMADSGIPMDLRGFDAEGDASILDIESRIRDGIAPRINGIHSHAIKLSNGKTAIVLRIPRSYATPHMVKFQGVSRFYARASNGKFQLDVDEIRTAFLASDTLHSRIRDFRLDRTARILAGDTPTPMQRGPKAVLHIVPLGALDAPPTIDLAAITDWSALAPIGHNTSSHVRVNFEGLLITFRFKDQSDAVAYTQMHRSGIMETADHNLFASASLYSGVEKAIPGRHLESVAIGTVHRYLGFLKGHQINLPAYIMLSLLDANGYSVVQSSPYTGIERGEPIDRKALLLPEDPFGRG